jgi:hypothetical protein
LKRYFSPELGFWLIAILFLACIDPSNTHFSFCVFKQLGISICPGCGLGRSVSSLLHGDLARSLEIHVLGTFALAVIVYRILQLTIKKPNYGKSVSNT